MGGEVLSGRVVGIFAGVRFGISGVFCEGDEREERWLSDSRLCGKSEGEGVFERKRKKEKMRHECCSE